MINPETITLAFSINVEELLIVESLVDSHNLNRLKN